MPNTSHNDTQDTFTSESIANEWVRLPKAGPNHRFWGLSRTTLTELCLSSQVRSTLIKKRGALRGIRLVYLPSLREYLLTQGTRDEQQKGGSNE